MIQNIWFLKELYLTAFVITNALKYKPLPVNDHLVGYIQCASASAGLFKRPRQAAEELNWF